MNKTTACYILHYGKEWLNWSMRSVAPFVDEIRVFYTPKPSHGHSSNLRCPETRDELYEISKQHLAVWDERTYKHEGHHRDFAYETCAQHGAGKILVVDADEIWLPEVLSKALHLVDGINGVGRVRNWRINMMHFWRSLDWVCYDGMFPLRIIQPGGEGEGYIPVPNVGRVLHMGYAQSPEITRYKMSIHGHKNEIRPGWYERTFLPWQPGKGDVHPTCENTWDPVEYDKYLIADLIGDHPYFQKELIQ